MAARTRWNYFKDRLIERFGEKVYKVGVDAGFTCPNRDGVKAFGGCAYCSQEGSFSPHQDATLQIEEQIRKGMSFCKRRYKANKYIVYFQAFTNTYDKNEVLRERYDSALIDESIVGLSVASRPDCITPENIDLLQEYAERLPFFTIELGLQSAYQNRLEWVNRQESVDDFLKAMELLNKAKVPVITHIIYGFPGETEEEMLEAVDIAQNAGTHGLKLQMLHIIKGTKLAHLHSKEPLELMDMKTYGELILKSLTRIRPEVELHRITGETDDASLVAPDWVRHKTKFFDWIDNEMESRNLRQGCALTNNEKRPFRTSP